MAENEDLFRSKFEKIRKRYVDSLPERLEELESAFNTADASAETSQANGGLRELVQLSHKLAGSGASFGFPLISEAARDLEKT